MCSVVVLVYTHTCAVLCCLWSIVNRQDLLIAGQGSKCWFHMRRETPVIKKPRLARVQVVKGLLKNCSPSTPSGFAVCNLWSPFDHGIAAEVWDACFSALLQVGTWEGDLLVQNWRQQSWWIHTLKLLDVGVDPSSFYLCMTAESMHLYCVVYLCMWVLWWCGVWTV